MRLGEEQYYVEDGIYAIGFKGKGKVSGKGGTGECYNFGSMGHFSPERP